MKWDVAIYIVFPEADQPEVCKDGIGAFTMLKPSATWLP